MILTLRIETPAETPTGTPDLGRRAIAVDARGIAVGRGAGMDWVLHDPDRFLSLRHFEIRHEAGAFWLHDRSTNGTFVNDSPDRIAGPRRLADGDRLRAHPYGFRVTIGAAAAGADFLPLQPMPRQDATGPRRWPPGDTAPPRTEAGGPADDPTAGDDHGGGR